MSLPLLLLLLTAGETPAVGPADHYPDRARRLEIEGRVLLECEVLETGLMSECVVLEETPPDYGFGAAALKMSRLFKMKPMIRDGVPVAGAKVKIPLVFRPPQ